MHCAHCHRPPSSIQEYLLEAQMEECTPEEFVSTIEGTYNPDNELFWCTECYIILGMPKGTPQERS